MFEKTLVEPLMALRVAGSAISYTHQVLLHFVSAADGYWSLERRHCLLLAALSVNSQLTCPACWHTRADNASL
jgi:hypothetical protein